MAKLTAVEALNWWRDNRDKLNDDADLEGFELLDTGEKLELLYYLVWRSLDSSGDARRDIRRHISGG